MTIRESVRINCMIDKHTGGFRLKGFVMRGVFWQQGNNGATPLGTNIMEVLVVPFAQLHHQFCLKRDRQFHNEYDMTVPDDVGLEACGDNVLREG